MLFIYSEDGLAENWLGNTVIATLLAGMEAISAGQPLPKWPACIPEERRAILATRTGLRDRIRAFWKVFAELDPPVRVQLQQAMVSQTDLPEIFSNGQACPTISGFDAKVRVAATSVFRFAFELLSELTVGAKCVRDIQFAAIYENLGSRLCPFCGLGYFRAPGAPRHDLDHYMLISKYPFAGADLRNLPPMCSECNQDFKKTADVLHDVQGNRRVCSDPFGGPVYSISLLNSRLFQGAFVRGIQYPAWQVDFVGPAPQATAWDEIFHIKERYERDVLNAEFLSWLRHFANWFVRTRGGIVDEDLLEASIPEYIGTVIQEGWADRAFIKAEVFQMLRQECSHPLRGPEAKSWLLDIVSVAGH